MARIRCIKPAFFKNEQLAELSLAHRLLFIGLWTQADRDGRLEDRPRRLKAELFPYDDDVDVSAMLQDMARGDDSLIVRYTVDGRGYIWIRKFLDHQRPHYSEPPSLHPEPSAGVAVATESSAVRTEDVVPPTEKVRPATLGREGKGKEGKGKEGEGVGAPRLPSPDDLALLWNAETQPPIPKCAELNDKRRRTAQVRLRERPLDAWRAVIQRIQVSNFCRGQNDRAWVATFDWLLQPDTATKVLEGKYDNRTPIRSLPARPTAAQITIATANRG